MKTELIKTTSAEVEVPMNWLLSTLEGMAKVDAEQVQGDKQSYIDGRKDHLYEELGDTCFAEEIVDLAIVNGVILSSKSKKELHVEETYTFEEVVGILEKSGGRDTFYFMVGTYSDVDIKKHREQDYLVVAWGSESYYQELSSFSGKRLEKLKQATYKKR